MSKFVMTIFGASGDLTKRKLMPALYSLYVAFIQMHRLQVQRNHTIQ